MGMFDNIEKFVPNHDYEAGFSDGFDLAVQMSNVDVRSQELCDAEFARGYAAAKQKVIELLKAEGELGSAQTEFKLLRLADKIAKEDF